MNLSADRRGRPIAEFAHIKPAFEEAFVQDLDRRSGKRCVQRA